MINTYSVIMTVGEKRCAVVAKQVKYEFSLFQSALVGRFPMNLPQVQAKFCILEILLGRNDYTDSNS
jgi:hypothetical protein